MALRPTLKLYPHALFTKLVFMKRVMSVIVAIACAGLLWLGSCKKGGTTSRVNVMLKDAPAHYEKVKLQISGIQLFIDETGNWVTVPFNDGIIDILQFRDTSLFIGSVNVPLGTISQVRLILGQNNTVVIGGFEFPLMLLSGLDDGLTIKVHEKITPGIFKLVVDFDAAQSIFDDGDGHHFHIKGVLHEGFGEDHDNHERHGGHDD
jgi:hypothetical protein